MAKCLVTKLQGAVNDSSLIKIGELRLKVNTCDSPTSDTQSFFFKTSKTQTLSIVGDGYFTDSTLQTNNGKTITIAGGIATTQIFVSNGDFSISIPDKYSITRLELFNSNIIGLQSGNLDELAYCTGMQYLRILNDDNIYGTTASLKAMTKMIELVITNCPNISGGFKEIIGMPSLQLFYWINNGDLVGNISYITLANLLDLRIKGSNANIVGDISAIAPKLRYLSLSSSNSVLNWKNTRPSSSTIYAMEVNLNSADTDTLLNNMAQCTSFTAISSSDWAKKINITGGERTSASDSAVATLKEKGLIVNINGIVQ